MSLDATVQVGNALFFLFTTSGVDFDGASNFCSSNGASLARISSAAEHTAIAGIVSSLGLGNIEGTDNFWIGIRAVDGQKNPANFFYTDGDTEHLDFIHVGRGEFPWGNDVLVAAGPEPNNDLSNGVAENCANWVIMNFSQEIENGFNDVACTLSFPKVLCRSEIITEAPTSQPTKNPTKFPTKFPTKSPTKFPTVSPTKNPTKFPTTASPSKSPTTVNEKVGGGDDNKNTEHMYQMVILAFMAIALVALFVLLAKLFRLTQKSRIISKKLDSKKFELELEKMSVAKPLPYTGTYSSALTSGLRYTINDSRSVSSEDI